MYYFLCFNEDARRKAERVWTSEISNLCGNSSRYEMDVTGRGSSFHIIFGKYQHGNYICIPNWNVGCELSSLTDTFWNFERIQSFIGKVDAITVTSALMEVNKLIKSKE